ncbi:MAG: AgmX/PglI C-terminal domain-containing protein, partial [Oligoflexales bacterium]|nr:AgmX/PglI C-terminal domain-containing protein [Oligoflexales bacterium]
SIEMYSKAYQKQKAIVENAIESQEKLEAEEKKKTGYGILKIPTVFGESFPGMLLRLKDKYSIYHEELEDNLKLRRETTKKFNDPEDGNHEFRNFRSLNQRRSPRLEVLGKISVWGQLTDENAMYYETEQLAKNAAAEQRKIEFFAEPKIILTQDNSAPIRIAGVSSQTSFLALSSLEGLDKKLEMINASFFGSNGKTEIIKEPLVGEINPKLIESIITKNKFEIQLCYELALRRNKTLNGKMEWKWRLDSRGTLSELALVDSTIEDRRMAHCIQNKIASWKFPRPNRGSVEITYPFYFSRSAPAL